MLWGWEPRKLRCGWYNSSVMIWDVALLEKKETLGTRFGKFIHIKQFFNAVYIDWKVCIAYFTQKVHKLYYTTVNKWKHLVKKLIVSNIENANHKTAGRNWETSNCHVYNLWLSCLLLLWLKSYFHVSYTSHHWNLVKYRYRLRWNEG